MEKLAEVLGNIPMYLTLVISVLVSLIALFSVIPGEQPEKALQGVVDFLKKFSKK